MWKIGLIYIKKYIIKNIKGILKQNWMQNSSRSFVHKSKDGKMIKRNLNLCIKGKKEHTSSKW